MSAVIESEKVGAIYEAMAHILADVDAIAKSTKNKDQGFMYRGIDAVYNTLNPLLAKYRVFTTSEILSKTREERVTAKGTTLAFTCLRMRYRFNAFDGSHVSSEIEGEAMDAGDKSSNKAMAIAHKYALLQAFCIPTEDVVDPDSEVYDVQPMEPPPTRSARQEPAKPATVTAPAWDWRTTLPAFDKLEGQMGHTRFVEALGSHGFTALEEVPRNRESFSKLYKRMLIETELFGTDPTPELLPVPATSVAAEPAAPVSASVPEPSPVVIEPAPVAQPTPAPAPTRNGMPAELEALWKRCNSFAAMLGCFSDLRKDMNEVAGMDAAEKLYSDILGRHGATSPHSFRNLGKARVAISALWAQIQLLKNPTPVTVTDDGRAA